MADRSHSGSPSTVLIVNLYTEMGGGEHTLSHILERLDRSKWNPVMMFNSRGAFVEKVESLGIRTVVLPYPSAMLRELVKPWVLRDAFLGARRIRVFLKENRVDLIQCGDVLSLILVAWPVLRLRIPVIFTMIFYYEWARLVLFNMLAIPLVKLIVTNSAAVKENLLRRSMLLGRKVVTIRPGVDKSVFHPTARGGRNLLCEEFNIPDGVRLVGMLGRYDPSKGHEIFLQAASLVLRSRKDVVFFIAGGTLFSEVLPSIRRYHKAVRCTRTELGLDQHVLLLDHRNDIPEVLRSLDVVVCPSLSEGFGLVILEALASRVPVILSPAVGALELVRGLEGVFVAEAGSAESFAANIQSALSMRAARPGEARSFLPDDGRFSWESCCRQYEEAYATLTTRARKPRRQERTAV